jgi:hypothetical protein
MFNFLSFIFIVITLAMLSGCAQVNMQATTYHSSNFSTNQKTYAYIPLSKLNQAEDPQYSYFTRLIDSHLQAYGMKKTSLRQAQYTVILLYYVGNGQERTTYLPLIGQVGTNVTGSYTTGQYTSFGNSGIVNSQTTYVTTPVYGVTGVVPEEYTSYPYFLGLLILNKADSKYINTTGKHGKAVYSAQLQATLSYNNPAKVFPMMINGLFKVFPGQDGQSVLVPIP